MGLKYEDCNTKTSIIKCIDSSSCNNLHEIQSCGYNVKMHEIRMNKTYSSNRGSMHSNCASS